MTINHQQRSNPKRLDRISSLPTEVMDEIFKRMLITDAVKTSMLSTIWRHKWMTMSRLVFDGHLFAADSVIPRNDDRVSFVNNVLFLHDGSLFKFKLKSFLDNGCSDINRWILVLSRKNINSLVFQFYGTSAYAQVPASLFSCQSLRSLTLVACKFSSQIQLQGLCNLTKLTLRDVDLTDEIFEKLLGKLHLLKKLRVFCCEPLARFNIQAPNLTFLDIVSLCHSINITNTPKLQDLRLNIWLPNDHSACKLDQVLGKFYKLDRLELSQPILDTAQKNLHTIYHCVKHLYLTIDYEDSEQILALMFLCRSTLQSLNITSMWRSGQTTSISEDRIWDGEMQKGGVLRCLKTVKLERFKGVHNEVGFAKFILLNAGVLDTLNIEWEKSLHVDKQLVQVLQELMRCKRASSEAEVIFSDLI